VNYQQRPFEPMEFELAVECCRWAFAGGDKEVIHQLVPQIDANRFLIVARRHRVQGLIWHCLHALDVSLPAQLSKSLRNDALQIVEHGLRAANEMANLLQTFHGAGIPVIFIKGLTLGKLAYSNPFLKMGWDIDLLVPAGMISAAAAELERMNYRLTAPAVQTRSTEFERWHRKRKESVWYKSERRIHLELHSGLADNARLIPGIGINSPQQQVEITSGIVLPTLALEELFAYLCVHGASSAWFRLKWITDLAALLHGRDAKQIEHLYQRSQHFGAGRAASQALLLSSCLYGTQITSSLRHDLETDPANRWLARISLAEMAGRAAVTEPADEIVGTAMNHLSQFFLLPSWRFKTSELFRQLSAMGT